MKILVTGGAGFIGSHTANYLKEKGHDVSILDDLSRGRIEVTEGFPLYKTDLRDREGVESVLRGKGFDGIIHFAGLIAVGESVKDPGLYFDVNISGTINLLNSAVNNKIPNFVFSSSAAVYGNPTRVPIQEDDPVSPTSPYGECKLQIERLFPWYVKTFGINFVALRYFNAAGAMPDASNGEAHTPETHIIPFIARVVSGKSEKFKVFGGKYPTADGTNIRDYIHVLDLAKAHLLALEFLASEKRSEYFNLGTGMGYSNLEVIKTFEAVSGKDIPFEIVENRPGDPAILIAGNNKAKSVLGWEPEQSDLRTIISHAWNWHQKNPWTLNF